jgi:hypothetical protein
MIFLRWLMLVGWIERRQLVIFVITDYLIGFVMQKPRLSCYFTSVRKSGPQLVESFYAISTFLTGERLCISCSIPNPRIEFDATSMDWCLLDMTGRKSRPNSSSVLTGRRMSRLGGRLSCMDDLLRIKIVSIDDGIALFSNGNGLFRVWFNFYFRAVIAEVEFGWLEDGYSNCKRWYAR